MGTPVLEDQRLHQLCWPLHVKITLNLLNLLDSIPFVHNEMFMPELSDHELEIAVKAVVLNLENVTMGQRQILSKILGKGVSGIVSRDGKFQQCT